MVESSIYEKSGKEVAVEQTTSILGSLLLHAAFLLLAYLFITAFSSSGGGGGGSGHGNGTISVSLIGTAAGTDRTGDDGVSEPGAETEPESDPGATEQTDSRQYTRPGEGIVPPDGEKESTGSAQNATGESAQPEKRKQQAAASGIGDANDGSGIGTGKGNGAGSGTGNGIGSGQGNGVGNGIGDGEGDGVSHFSLPPKAFRFERQLGYCGKDDANVGNVVVYTVEYTTGEAAPKISHLMEQSKFKPSSRTVENVKNFISESFDSSAIVSAKSSKKSIYEATIKCDCMTSQCELVK